ncbi:MAG: radical SAM protein [Myxococcota bacterium]
MVRDSGKAFDNLRKAIIKWGYSCNSDCIFCHSAEYRDKKSLTISEIKRKIDSAKRLGVKILLFSGGEPLLIKDIENLFRYTFSRRMYSGLITNGRILSDKIILQKLYNAGLRYVYMSLVSTDKGIYKKVTQVDGLNESVKAILNIQSIPSIMFTVNIPIVKDNLNDIVDSVCKLALLGVRRIKLSVIEPKGNAYINYKEVVPPLAGTADVIKKAIEIEKFVPNISVYHDGLPYCLSPDYERYNRDMYSENILYMSESFEKKFFRVDYQNMAYVNGVCNSCSKKRRCRGIYRGYIENSDTPLLPIGKRKREGEQVNIVELNKDKNYEVNIGKLCNNSCIFCANGVISREENRFVEYEKIIYEIEKAYNDGFRSLSFLGGEITIHPDVIKIIEFAKRKGFERIALCTNGRRLSDIEFAERLVKAGVTRFMISIHSYEEGVENFLNGRKNAFSEKIEALKNLVKINKKRKIEHGVSLNSCIHKLNYNKLIEFCRFFKDIGINDIRFNFIRPENKVVFDKNIIPKLSEVRDYIESLILWNETEGKIYIAIGDIPFCLLPERILRDKRLLGKYIGELRDLDTFVTIFRTRTDPDFIERFSWRERKSNVLKAKSPVCAKCLFDSVCEGLFKNYINLYGIVELKPIERLPS